MDIKLAIVGGRDYTQYEEFHRIVDSYIQEIGRPSLILSGGATGVDTMAEKYAQEQNIPIIIFPADWQTFGKQAGPLRNIQIVLHATHVLALPTANSRGTYDTINKAKKARKIVKVEKV